MNHSVDKLEQHAHCNCDTVETDLSVIENMCVEKDVLVIFNDLGRFQWSL